MISQPRKQILLTNPRWAVLNIYTRAIDCWAKWNKDYNIVFHDSFRVTLISCARWSRTWRWAPTPRARRSAITWGTLSLFFLTRTSPSRIKSGSSFSTFSPKMVTMIYDYCMLLHRITCHSNNMWHPRGPDKVSHEIICLLKV